MRRRLRIGVMHPLRFAGPTPERLLAAPPDLRPADPGVARDFYAGRYPVGGGCVETAGSPFAPGLGDDAFTAAMHGFSWLRHLRASGADLAAANARALVIDWIRLTADSLDGVAWRPEVTAQRLMSWLRHSPVILQGAELPFYRAFLRSLAMQNRYLGAMAPDMPPGEERLRARLALAFAALSLPAPPSRLARASRDLGLDIEAQILPDGGHVSRNPAAILDLLADFLPLRQTYAAQAEPPPPALVTAIDRMAQALRFFLHRDDGLARFNGAGATDRDLVEAILRHDQTGAAAPLSAPHSGYQRLAAGGTTAICDTGAPPQPEFAGAAHAGCLAFELSSGCDVFVVNAGVCSHGPAEWRPLARSTAAHSTVTLADTSSARFALSGRAGEMFGAPLVGGPRTVTVERRDRSGVQSFRADHDGYARNFGVAHERTLALSADGVSLSGIDRFPDAAPGSAAAPVDAALRFHLHPDVGVWRDADGRVVLAAPEGDSWAFACADLTPMVEESLFFADASGARKTFQIVIDFSLAERRQLAWRFDRLVKAG
ncbi:MAG: heparinase II/III family protein [Phyllobacteriaceae bacterium]|nr:heparinase II/III family protein [Phyllobacteriaceae bacterium]